MFVMAKWKHKRTRDGRLAIFIVLPTASLDQEDGIRAGLETAEQLAVTFSWPSILFGAEKIMGAVCSFCTDLNDGQGPILAQGLRDSTDPLRSKEGQDVYSKCIITLTHPVKPNVSEDGLKFDGNDSSTLYMLRFEAFEQKFSMGKKRLNMRTFKGDTITLSSNAVSCTKNKSTTTDNSAPPITSAITASYE